MTVNTTLDSHGRREEIRLEVRDEVLDGTLIRRMNELRAGESLLAPALLEQEVVAAIPLEGDLPASGTPKALLGAAVGLELWHAKAESRGISARSKGLFFIIARPAYNRCSSGCEARQVKRGKECPDQFWDSCDMQNPKQADSIRNSRHYQDYRDIRDTQRTQGKRQL
jgi:hypothetical protein